MKRVRCILKKQERQGAYEHDKIHNHSQRVHKIISTHLLTVLTKRCNVILQIEQEQKGGCLYEYK